MQPLYAVHLSPVSHSIWLQLMPWLICSSTKRLELLPGQSHVQGQVESATAVQAVAFDAQAKHIVIGGDDKTLQLWSVQTWQLLQRW